MGLTRPNYNNLDTSKFEIGDPITEINVNLSDTNPNNTDIGFIFKRGTTGNNTALLWDKSSTEFMFISTTATGDSSGDLPITDYSDLRVKLLTATSLKAGNLNYPTSDGTVNQVIATNGFGVLSFQNQSAGSWGSIAGTLSTQTDLQTALDLKANLISPDFTGIPTVPTALVNNNTTQIASTAFVLANNTTVIDNATSTSTTDALSANQGKLLNDNKANLSSPALTGTPTTPTATIGTNTTQIASTAFVLANVSSSSNWGSIIGTLSTQTDLQTELDVKVDSDPSGVTGANKLDNMFSISQADYDNISVPDTTTLYVII